MSAAIQVARLEAHEPPEARGLRRDEVRLMVASRHDGRLVHTQFRELPQFLEPGDLLVVNVSDKLLPFKYNSSQNYDFVITDPATGQEVWRWSRGTVFAQVVRSDSIRGSSKWTYSELWSRRDNDRNPVPPGRYRLVGILASQPPIQSEPIS